MIMGFANTIMIDLFYIYALCACTALSVSFAPMGCFLLWQRQTFFGDTIAHSALLGVAIAFFFNVIPLIGIMAVCVVLSAILTYGPRYIKLSSDIWVSITAYTLFSAGLIAIRYVPKGSVRAETFLFGDVLLVTKTDLGVLIGIVTLVLIFLKKYKNTLLRRIIDSDFATIQGDARHFTHFLFLCVLSLTVAGGMSLVGAFLVPGLLILPGAIAFQFATSPHMMIRQSVRICLTMTITGIGVARFFDWPTSPTMIVVGFVMLCLSRVWGVKRG